MNFIKDQKNRHTRAAEILEVIENKKAALAVTSLEMQHSRRNIQKSIDGLYLEYFEVMKQIFEAAAPKETTMQLTPAFVIDRVTAVTLSECFDWSPHEDF